MTIQEKAIFIADYVNIQGYLRKSIIDSIGLALTLLDKADCAECCKERIEEEREACARIVDAEFVAHTFGGFKASECFYDAARKIRARSDP